MKKLLFVIVLLISPVSQAGTWAYEPWRTLENGSIPQARASLSTKQAGVQFIISLESVSKQPPVWVVTVSSADRLVALRSITALNPDRVQNDQVKVMNVERLEPADGEEGERAMFSARVTPDGMSSIKFSARVEIGVEIEGAGDCPTCNANTAYTIDTSDLGLAFVMFDIDAKRLSGIDVSRAYLSEYDRKHNPLNSIPQDLWMVTLDEVEEHRVQLGLTQDEILSMSQYRIEDALYDQAQQAFQERQAASAARDAAAKKAGENLFQMLTVFEFSEPKGCVAPDIPQVIGTQGQAEKFKGEVGLYQSCLKRNQDRDAGAYSAVIGVLGYLMIPDTYAVKEPEDQSFSGAVLLACENLVPEVGQCSSAISSIAKAFGERVQGVNQQYAKFQENAKHLYGQ